MKAYLSILMLLVCLSLGACAPGIVSQENSSQSMAMMGDSETKQYQRFSYQQTYDKVYYEALRVARSMSLQFLPSSNFPHNWYLEAEGQDKGHIKLSKSFSICQHKSPESCVTFTKHVTVAMLEAGSSTQVDIAASRENDQEELDFIAMYVDALNKSLN